MTVATTGRSPAMARTRDRYTFTRCWVLNVPSLMVSMSGLNASIFSPPNRPSIAAPARATSAIGSEKKGKSQATTARCAACATGSSRRSRSSPYQPCRAPPVRTQIWVSPACLARATTSLTSTFDCCQVVHHMPLPLMTSRETWRGPTGSTCGRSPARTAGLGRGAGCPPWWWCLIGGGGQGCGCTGGAGIGYSVGWACAVDGGGASPRTSGAATATPAVANPKAAANTAAPTVAVRMPTRYDGNGPCVGNLTHIAESGAGELHHADEEVVDLAHHVDELVEVHRLGDVGVGVQPVAGDHVVARAGGGQHHHRDQRQFGVTLDLGEHLTAVLTGQIEVEQDQVWDVRVGILALTPQISQGLHAVGDHREVVLDLVLGEGLLSHQHVAGIVLDQQHLDQSRNHAAGPPLSLPAVAQTGRVQCITVPTASAGRSVANQIRPPWYSTIFLHSERPMPVPVN